MTERTATPGWKGRLAECLSKGFADRALSAHLDDLLIWYNGIGDRNNDTLTRDLIHRYGEKELRRRFEKFLDQLISAGPKGYLGAFPPNVDRRQAKIRYRKLMRVFHPDRGVRSQDWLNDRAEKINVAFRNYNESLNVSVKPKQAAPASAHTYRHKTASTSRSVNPAMPRINPLFLRRMLGDFEVVQRRLIYGVIVASLLISGVLYFSTIDGAQRSSSVPSVIDSKSMGDTDSLGFIDEVSEAVPIDSDEDFEATHLPVNSAAENPDQISPDVPQKESSQRRRLASSTELLASIKSGGSSKEATEKTVHRHLSEDKTSEEGLSVKSHSEPAVELIAETSSTDRLVSGGQSIGNVKESAPYAIEGELTERPKRKDSVDPEIRQLLNTFQTSFITGDRNALTQLYMTSARENNLKGMEQIRDYYGLIFNSTEVRKLNIIISDIYQQDTYTAVIEGLINLGYGMSRDNLKRDIVDFKMVLIKTERDYRIAVFNWKEIDLG